MQAPNHMDMWNIPSGFYGYLECMDVCKEPPCVQWISNGSLTCESCCPLQVNLLTGQKRPNPL